MEHTYDFNVFH
jgi:hypothetical protein